MGIRSLILGSAVILPIGLGGVYYVKEGMKEYDLGTRLAVTLPVVFAAAAGIGTFLGREIREFREYDRERQRNRNR